MTIHRHCADRASFATRGADGSTRFGGAARPRERGFTILELCITLTLVTCVAAVSIWSYFSRAEVTLQNAAQLLVEDLHLAQVRASYTHSPIEIVFLPNGEGYYVVDANDADDGLLPNERVPRRYPADAIFEGVEILDRRMDSSRSLVFDSNGHANTNLTVVLSFASHTRTVTLSKRDGVAFVTDVVR